MKQAGQIYCEMLISVLSIEQRAMFHNKVLTQYACFYWLHSSTFYNGWYFNEAQWRIFTIWFALLKLDFVIWSLKFVQSDMTNRLHRSVFVSKFLMFSTGFVFYTRVYFCVSGMMTWTGSGKHQWSVSCLPLIITLCSNLSVFIDLMD